MADVTELVRYWNAMSREDTFIAKAGERATVKLQAASLRKKRAEQAEGLRFTVIALEGGRIVGHTSLCRARIHHRSMHRGEFGIGVEKGYRGEGIGTAMMRELEKKAKQWGLRLFVIGLFAENRTARKMYEKFGFKECGRIPGGLSRKGKYSDEVMMFKRLGRGRSA